MQIVISNNLIEIIVKNIGIIKDWSLVSVIMVSEQFIGD